jgi:hypothetical protein
VRHRIAGRDEPGEHGDDRRDAARDRLAALQDRQDAARDREQAALDRDSAKRRDGAGPGKGTGELGEDRQVGVEPDPLDSPDSER